MNVFSWSRSVRTSVGIRLPGPCSSRDQRMLNMGDLVETDLYVIGAGSSGLAVAAGAGTAASSGRFRPPDQARIPWRRITSDGGLLPYRELDDVLGLTGPAAMCSSTTAPARTDDIGMAE